MYACFFDIVPNIWPYHDEWLLIKFSNQINTKKYIYQLISVSPFVLLLIQSLIQMYLILTICHSWNQETEISFKNKCSHSMLKGATASLLQVVFSVKDHIYDWVHFLLTVLMEMIITSKNFRKPFLRKIHPWLKMLQVYNYVTFFKYFFNFEY